MSSEDSTEMVGNVVGSSYPPVVIVFVLGDGFIDENDLRKTLIELRLKFTDVDVDEMLSEFIPHDAKSRRLDIDDFLSIVA